MSGGSTTGALSTLPARSHFAASSLAIPISRLVQAAIDACSAEPAFEFLPLSLTH